MPRVLSCLFAVLLAVSPHQVHAQQAPYDGDLLKLSEILGALHYLRTLCGAEDAASWRERMQALIEAESCAPDRCERLAGAFNKEFQSFSRTYRSCTPSARLAIERYLAEGSRLADGINARNGN